MAAEFKIGRLRYTWAGPWTASTTYQKDAVVSFGGQTYVCLTAHTSTTFVADLASSIWSLAINGTQWKNAWTPGTQYFVGNIVRYGGEMYICIVSHTSGLTQIDSPNWTTYSLFDNWNSNWTTSYGYGVGDVVKYGGIVYRCNTTHISNQYYSYASYSGVTPTVAFSSTGLEADQSKWDIVYNGYDIKGNWSSANYRYRLNDIVKNGADQWVCIAGHVSSTAFSTLQWAMYMPGFEFANTWGAGNTYQPGDVVDYGGYSYINNVPNNTNVNPSTDTGGNWSVMTSGYEALGQWGIDFNGLSKLNYKIGDVVRRGGLLFIALQDNTNQDPSAGTISLSYNPTGSSGTTVKVVSTANVTVGMVLSGTGFTLGQTVTQVVDATTLLINNPPDGTPLAPPGGTLSAIGINYTYWNLVSFGLSFKGIWQQLTSYVPGDIVVYQNKTYKAIVSSNSSTPPNQDTTNSIWTVYLPHAIRNAMNSQGDMVTYRAGVPTALPITTPVTVGSTTTNVPLVDYLLRMQPDSNGVLYPTWSQFNITPKVYYVATTGIDRSDYGVTYDRPWKTIAYACSQVANGTNNPIAGSILLANKEFMAQEVYQWMVYQSTNNVLPFSSSSVFDQTKTLRDTRYLIDAIIYDITRGGNSQTVAAALSYFAPGSTNQLVTSTVTAEIAYFLAAVVRLKVLLDAVINKTPLSPSYQVVNGVASPISQVTSAISGSAETGSQSSVDTLIGIVIQALTDQSTSNIPTSNSGTTANIFIKTGTYSEILPISVPENTALVGDELRGVVVQPATRIITTATASVAATQTMTLSSVTGLVVGMPIQFYSASMLGGLTRGTTYYVAGINGLNITLSGTSSLTPTLSSITDGAGSMTVYAGDCLKNMFLVRNGSGIRNMSTTGLLGFLTDFNAYLTQRPTGGAYVSLDPGTGPNDTSAWIFRRSPYIQNVTTFGSGCVGLKIDGTLHNGGNKSIVANDFTQVLSDGVGVWCTGISALTECVSVFTYYNYSGYLAENGGRIRATNGNSSYGTFGVLSEGYDLTETPISGNVFNQSSQVQASVQSSFGVSANLLKMQYGNGGGAYYTNTTNMLLNSNLFSGSGWTNDGNLILQQNLLGPFGNSDGWTLTGTSSGTDGSYVYQNIAIQPAAGYYASVSGTTIVGGVGASGATFNVTVGSSSYSVITTPGSAGSGYSINNQILIYGNQLGGVSGVNDLTITVTSLASGTGVGSVTVSGVVPTGSNLPYTFSVYVKQGTSPSIDVLARYSGSSIVDSLVNFNFNTGIVTASSASGGAVPTSYGKVVLTNGWYRLWFTTYDITAQNNNVQLRLYPRTQFGTSAYTYVFGAQVQVSSALTFYLQTSATSQFSAYANYFINGSGSGASVVGDETRSNAIFETRVTTDSNGVTGGANYITASNNAQGGTSSYVILAQSDNNTASNYVGTRVFINSGTGAGQYGYISAYTTVNKYAYVLKESFTPLNIVASTSPANTFTIIGNQNTSTLYTNQPVQFIPTYYSTSVTATGNDILEVTATSGNTNNTITVSSTARLAVGMSVIFTGSNLYGNITAGYYFYIKSIPSSTTFTISASLGGTAWGLTAGTSTLGSGSMYVNFPSNTSFLTGSTTNMLPNMPIQFTGTSIGGVSVGTTYYVNRVINATSFSLSTTLVTVSPTTTVASSKQLTVTSTANLISLNPIKFSGTIFGGMVSGTTYYISNVVDSNHFKITSNVIEVRVTATDGTTNLITASTTTGFIVGNPITFSGTTFGGLTTETVYYVLAINTVGVNGTFTISSTPVGSPNIVTLQTGAGDMLCRTADADFAVSDATGSSMIATSTGPKKTLTYGSGNMNGTYSTSVFGSVTQAQTYYIRTINSGSNTFTVTASSGGSIDFANTTDSGSMNLAMVGWDHINPGTPIVNSLDSTSLYYIEPRTTYSSPTFTQTATQLSTLTLGNLYVGVAYGNGLFISIPNATSVATQSTDGINWTNLSLPTSATWSGIAYGNSYWVIISSGGTGNSTALVSHSNAVSWRITTLPSVSTWSAVAYGNGYFVAISSTASGPYASGAYSTNFGLTWNAVNLPALGSSSAWTGLAYGAGKFVVLASGGTLAAYSTGTTWTTVTLPSSAAWTSIAFGNNRFVAVSSTSAQPAYSFDGITWYQSPYSIAATSISYGQGVFVAVNSGSITGYTSEDGLLWTQRSVTSDSYGAMTFGFDTNHIGKFVTVSGVGTGSMIQAGCTARGRAVITSGTITSISMWETGSNYTSTPTIIFTDPNITTVAQVTPRVASGTLSGPTFINRGSGYNTNSTSIIISGDGYADAYQTGYTLILNNLTRLPSPGDNLSISGNSLIYKVTSSTAMFGTVSPSIEANVQISPAMITALSPANNTSITIRTKYSQVRLTNHDFLNIGYGNQTNSNYPGVPINGYTLASQNQAVESNNGRVFYTSTDQDGNFKVGNLFGVQQATGIITLSASQFGLTGLNQLTLGGIAVGGSSVVIQQFSTDATFLANSDTVVPTQKAIKTFLTSKLSQGGSNTFTSVLTAGLVVAGGPAFISNTIPQGVAGSSVQMLNKVNINGQYGGIDGNMIAMEFFIKNGVHR